MKSYAEYVSALRALVETAASAPVDVLHDAVAAALDGQPGRELRRLIPIDVRRADGAFFTGSELARRLVSASDLSLPEDWIVCDPACGAGDLLIAAVERLPVRSDLRETLAFWSERLHGFDIHSEFVEAARLRLVLAAIRRGARSRQPKAEDFSRLLHNIKVCDGTRANYEKVSLLLMNPPYGAREAPAGCEWGTGLVSDAAVFTAEVLERAGPATRVAALLPDVLRSGSRYAKWRQHVEELVHVDTIEPIGIFDRWADVDVFAFTGHKRDGGDTADVANWWSPTTDARLGDRYEVRVGAVVPHRDPKRGPWCRYIHAQTISNCKQFDISEAPRRRFDRRTFRPPFVVVRRTSRPDDRIRIRATLVLGDENVAVENHLLVILPRRGTIDECKILVDVLTRGSTADWLNDRIRCRHLTVGAVADIPWPQ